MLSQQQLLLGNLRREDDVYYLTSTGGGKEIKRPNIISRRNNLKVKVVEALSTISPPANALLDHHIFSYVEPPNAPAKITLIPESVPIELIPPTGMILTEGSYAVVSELSLAIEPTVVSQAFPAEVPLYDSTCVSQAIPTPIVTPLVSSTSQASDHHRPSVAVSPPAVHLYCEQQDENDPLALNGDPEVVFLQSFDQLLASGGNVVKVQGDWTTNAEFAPQNQERAQAQQDGTFVLYLGVVDSSAEVMEPISDAEIIQTDTFPVLPNTPIEFPINESETESFILVPIDDQGTSVLVPTSSTVRPRLPHRMRISQQPRLSFPPLIFQSGPTNAALDSGEKPKPYRYELPEDDVSSTTKLLSEAPVIASLSSIECQSQVNNYNAIVLEQRSPEVPNSNIESKVPTVSRTDSHDARRMERSALGVFKCKFCSRESRLKVLMLNHVKRFHKDKDAQHSYVMPPPRQTYSTNGNEDGITTDRTREQDGERQTEMHIIESELGLMTNSFEIGIEDKVGCLERKRKLPESTSKLENVSDGIKSQSQAASLDNSSVRIRKYPSRKQTPTPTTDDSNVRMRTSSCSIGAKSHRNSH